MLRRLKYMLAPWKKSYDQHRQHIKKQRYYFANKCLSSQSYVFSSSHGWMWELDCKESWVQKNWCFWTVLLKKTLERTARRSNQSMLKELVLGVHWRDWCSAETPILWPSDVKNSLIWKDPDAGKYWRWEKGTTEDEMARWHHRLNGHEFEQASGVGEGQGSLACCSPRGHKVLDVTERLNWTEYTAWSCISLLLHRLCLPF